MRKNRKVQWWIDPLLPDDWFWTAGPLGRVVGIESDMLRYQWLLPNHELSTETRRMRINRIIATPPLDCIPKKYWSDVRDLDRWGPDNWFVA